MTMVLDEKNMVPVAILIHPGSPNDAKLFESTLKELQRMHIIRNNDIILCDRGYYSYKNYQIGINKYKIIPLIFPRSTFNKEKFKARMSYPLDIYKEKKNLKKHKHLIESLNYKLLIKLENWKDYKSIIGIMEDFFKVTKDAFYMSQFHAYTTKSMYKNIYLCILLTSLVIQQGYKTKTHLQQLAEGNVELKPPKKKKTKKSNKEKENNEKTETPYKIEQQTLLICSKEQQTTIHSFSNF